MATITINGERVEVDAGASHPLLWVLRERLGLTGTKFGCGIGQCGACTVLLDGEPVRSCQLPLSAAEGGTLTTIEGLTSHGEDRAATLHPVQEAWIEEQVPQCGYCQSGQIMSAAALLADNDDPSDEDIDLAMSGNVCRCGAYSAIRRAIHRAAEIQRGVDATRSATDAAPGAAADATTDAEAKATTDAAEEDR